MLNKPVKVVVANLLLVLVASYASAQSQNLAVTIVDSDGEVVDDAVVEVILPAQLQAQFKTPAAAVVDQVDKEFVPTVTTVVAGSQVSFPNSDDILHHVYSFSPVNTFDIPLYGSEGNMQFVEEFPVPGVVEIGCNIHDWMLAYIYVSESSKVAVSDVNGQLQISDIPAGTYDIRVWHARLPRNTDYHVVNAVDFTTGSQTIEVELDLERDRRIRRAPSANRKRYR